ncbi:flagellar biosynthetic protein FliR [Methylophilus sp.]|uniref:flagellar biosynthetic protein FliR n=1 Tax=Methylophilus sp. TaxID=29541 RepID=UPI00403619AB
MLTEVNYSSLVFEENSALINRDKDEGGYYGSRSCIDFSVQDVMDEYADYGALAAISHDDRHPGQYFSGGHPNSGDLAFFCTQACYGSRCFASVRPLDVAFASQLRISTYQFYSAVFAVMVMQSLLTWAGLVLIASIRLGMIFISTPLLGNVPMPRTAKVILVLGLSLLFLDQVQPTSYSLIEPANLIVLIVTECLAGAMLACSILITFAVFHFAGRLLDSQIGFGLAGLVDLATRNNMPLLGTVLSMAAIWAVMALEGHWALMQVVQLSYEVIPLGGSVYQVHPQAMLAYFGSIFSFGFMVVAPIVAALFIVDLAMAFMSRTMPQMNVFVMSLAVKVIVGLLMLAMTLPHAGFLFKRIFDALFDSYGHVLGVHGG